MRWATEVGVALSDPVAIRDFQQRGVDHWLGPVSIDVAKGADAIADAFATTASMNATLPPVERRGFLLPFPETQTKRFGRYVPGLPEELA